MRYDYSGKYHWSSQYSNHYIVRKDQTCSFNKYLKIDYSNFKLFNRPNNGYSYPYINKVFH